MDNYVGSYNTFSNKLIRNFCFPANERGIGVRNLSTCCHILLSTLYSVFIAEVLNRFVPRYVLLAAGDRLCSKNSLGLVPYKKLQPFIIGC